MTYLDQNLKKLVCVTYPHRPSMEYLSISIAVWLPSFALSTSPEINKSKNN